MRLDHLAAQLERPHRLLARDARKIVQELVQGVATFQVVEQAAYRYPGSNKDGRSPQDIH